MQITIKTFKNGDVLTYAPAYGGIGEISVNGKYAAYYPFLSPKIHPSGVKIAAMLKVGKQEYALTPDDIAAMLDANKHYTPTIFDLMGKLESLEEAYRNAKEAVGNARSAAVEHTRIHGRLIDYSREEQTERDCLAEAELAFEDAKRADPEAWSELLEQRSAAIDRAMNN
jgi:hypothetical protein